VEGESGEKKCFTRTERDKATPTWRSVTTNIITEMEFMANS